VSLTRAHLLGSTVWCNTAERAAAYVLETIFLTAVPAEDTPARGPVAVTPETTFASLGVPAPLVAVLDRSGITAPFPIQAATLPDAMAARDILGRAKTGSGKTLGFSLPLVARLAGGTTSAHRPRGLILVPTRELATQVEDVLVPLARAMGLRATTIYGGVSYRPQIIALQRATDILVACPGRLADLIGQGECDLSEVEVTVIDEADQMADLGFLPVVRRLLEDTPSDGQRLLFSATLDSAIDVLARRFLNNPARHSVDENSSPAEIEHHVLTVDFKNRLEVIGALAGGAKRTLIFTRTKHGAERLARQLTTAGIPAAELHGNLRQGARARNLAAFSTGVANVMVATDIAARGIHVDGVELVIHADPPAEHKAYVHRSGRTARGGADGIVVTMQTAQQAREVRRLMREAGVAPQVDEVTPESAVLREIAGEPAPRVRLTKSVTDMVKLPGRHPARQPGDDSRGPGKRRPGQAARRRERDTREGRDRFERADRPREDRPREGRDDRQGRDDRPERSSRDFRPSRDQWRSDSGPRGRGQSDRGQGSWHERRDSGHRGGDRYDDRRDDRRDGERSPNDWYPRERRDSRPNGGGAGRSWGGNDRSWGADHRPARTGGPSGRAGGPNRRPSAPAGRRADNAGRAEFSGRRNGGGNQRKPGQGRNF
jgi:superfamily II DNA/RNA helicase